MRRSQRDVMIVGELLLGGRNLTFSEISRPNPATQLCGDLFLRAPRVVLGSLGSVQKRWSARHPGGDVPLAARWSASDIHAA